MFPQTLHYEKRKKFQIALLPSNQTKKYQGDNKDNTIVINK